MIVDPPVLLRRMFDAAVARASARICLPPFLSRLLPRLLLRAPRGRVIVVGAGKAAAAMAQVVESRWSADVEIEGVVVTRRGHGVPTETIEVLEAAHPVPDATGTEAARRILGLVRGRTPDDLILCLMSGGASALLALPAPGLTLEDKRAISRALLASGATIAEMNCVRKHLSAIKGGRLAVACHPARVVTLVISDVPGDDPATVGSGPTVADTTTFAEARAVLAKYGVTAPPAVVEHLRAATDETPRADDARLAGIETHVIAAAGDAIAAAAEVARAAGVSPIVLGDDLEGESRDVAANHARVVGDIVRQRGRAAGPWVLLSGGETTVTVRGQGRGGRNTEYLLALTTALGGAAAVHALAADTDGIDGTEDNAGAVMSPTTLARAQALGLDARAHLQRNDAYPFFAALGDLLITGPTLTNVNDFRAVYVQPSP
ncbi:MAG: glycerate kinase [Pseudomonadota bacterium]